MIGQLAIHPFPGKPKDTVDYTFADTDKHTLSEMGADLTTREVYDNYLKTTVYVTSGSVYYGYGMSSNGAILSAINDLKIGSNNIEFYGIDQCKNVWFKSTVGSEVRIFVEN
jgi:hypothetical protein